MLTSMMSGCLRTGSIGIGVGRERNKEREGGGETNERNQEREGRQTYRQRRTDRRKEGKAGQKKTDKRGREGPNERRILPERLREAEKEAIQRYINNNEYLERLTRTALSAYTFFTSTYCQNSTHTA